MKTYLIFVIVLMTSFMTVHGGEKHKILYGPYLQSLSSGEAVISWVTNNESIGWIEIAPDDATSFYNKERLKIRILDADGKCLNEIIIDNNHYEKENTSNW